MREKSITIVPFFMDVLHKLLEEFNIIFREKQWILKDLVEKQALLFNNDLVHNYADLYKLTVEQILPLERMAQKSADNW
jgi:hypothetical protein